MCIRKCPSESMSNQGSQLIAAAKNTVAIASWEWSQIEEFCTERNIELTLAPAEGQ